MSAIWAPDVQTFWPLTTKWSPSRTARVLSDEHFDKVEKLGASTGTRFAPDCAVAIDEVGQPIANRDFLVHVFPTLGGNVELKVPNETQSGRVFRLLGALSAINAADGPTDLLASARHHFRWAREQARLEPERWSPALRE